MSVSRRQLLQGATALGLGAAAPLRATESSPSWESLASSYRTPDWFRDAKFGIWSHWGPQCVPEAGDWYGRLMYVQGHPAYEHHLKTYGHPSETGFMEIIGRWKAEAWDPAALMARYKKAGARYFMAMANHHDNFDLYDSTHHRWNSTVVGPKRDIVGTWEKLAREAGLRFAVSNHSAHAWHWWQTAYSYDAEGPKRGVRYDAYRLRKPQGAGTWWEGLDPQELYTGPTYVPPAGIDSIAAMNAWHDPRDGQWLEDVPPQRQHFADHWLARQRDLVAKYRPDMVYFDDYTLPFGAIGLAAVSEFYADSIARRGHVDVVVTGKRLSTLQQRAITEDVERGFLAEIRAEPWQTDTCIGDWHYNRARYETKSYMPAIKVIQRLCDVVSKNGNLMLNIPVRGDGSIDSEEEKVLDEITAWMAANGEAIYATRPWRVFGEGPTAPPDGMMSEDKANPFTADDIRFTVGNGVLNAFFLARPARESAIATLGRKALRQGHVERVELADGTPLRFRQEAEALRFTLPDAPGFVPRVRILGRGVV